MSPNTRAYLALGAVFLLGSATGAGAMYAHGRRAHGPFSDGFRGRTHSERRVAALVAEGLDNTAVAVRVGVSKRSLFWLPRSAAAAKPAPT